jgi:hypothetical protein
MTKGVGVGVRDGAGTGVCVGVKVAVGLRGGVGVGLAVVGGAVSGDVVGVGGADPEQAKAAVTASTTRTATNAEPGLLLRICCHVAGRLFGGDGPNGLDVLQVHTPSADGA